MEPPKDKTTKSTSTNKNKEDSIKQKARAEIQKQAQKKEISVSKKVEESGEIKQKTESKYIEVPSRKDVRGIPRAKLDVFTKKEPFEVPSKENKTRSGNHEYWKQGELDLKKEEKKEPISKKTEDNIVDKEKTEKKESPKKTEQKKVSSSTKTDTSKKTSSTSTTTKKKTSNTKASTTKKTSPSKKKKPTKKPETTAIKKKPTTSKKGTSTLNKKPKQKAKFKISIRNEFIYLFFIVLILILSYILIVKEDIFSLFNESIVKNEVSETIVAPKVSDNSFSSDFVYVGDDLKDLNTLNLKVQETNESQSDDVSSIININDEKLSGEYIKLTINKGLSATSIAQLLEDNNVCKKEDFLNYVIENNLDTQLRSGTYIIKKNSSINEIVSSIVESDSTIINIYPASTIDQVDKLLVGRKLISDGDFVQACTNLAKEKGLDFVEGWFTPATYKINNDFDVELLARIMLENTFKTLSPYLSDIAKSGYSIEDIIIIASLIQGETQNVDQMPIISSVIHNRLDNDMPLGIDATTRYELGNWSDELTQEIMDTITPYNTRRQKGLPPSGICLSSKEAIISAIYPLNTDLFYYIHDKEGNLITAKTYEEHLANIEERDSK